MLSVVIPTMWRYEPFPDFLEQMLDHALVHKVILINNDNTRTPVHSALVHPKLKMLDFGQNIFVNPAWNVGVYHSETSIVCIANDDITFDLTLFDKICEWYTHDKGCVGLTEDNNVPGSIEFELHTNQRCFGFGQLMFVHQHNWIDIPPDLNVYFGDNWIFDTHKQKYGSNYLIKNLHYSTPHALTSKEGFANLEKERHDYCKVLADYNIRPWHE